MGEELSSGRLKELVAQYNSETNSQIKVRGNSSIDLPPDLMKSFFLPLLEKIKNKVAELVHKVQEKNDQVGFIFMVGGFSESPYLKAEIKKEFDSSISVLVPKRP